MDVQAVVAGILQKVASTKLAEEDKKKEKEKKEDKKEIVKGMSSCKYAHSIADALDEISDNFEYNFGSELDKAQKLAYESPNTLARSTATGANFKDKNEHRDAMAVGEDPAMGDRGNENGITPNHLKTTLLHPPGGKLLYDDYKEKKRSAELLKTANVGDISKSIVGKIRSVADVMHHKLPSKPKINVNANTTAKINGVLEELAKASRTDKIIGTVGAAAMLGGLAYGGKLLYDDYKEKNDPANPPLYNKTADTYQKILKKLAGDKTAYESPNALRRMMVTDSGAGQQGYGSGKSDGNNLRSLIQTSNEKAMDYTKADAKKDYIKEQMGQVFDEVHPEKDTAVDRFIDRGADTSKLAGIKEVASKAKDVASRGVELAKGGKHIGTSEGVRRAGNTSAGFLNKAPRGEAVKSTAVRAGLAGAAGAAGYGAHKAMSKKADEETVSKMEKLVKEEKRDEKVEEKLYPGIHKEVAKEEHKKEAGLQDMAGSVLGGLAGAATKAHQMGSGAVNFVKQHPKALLGAGAGLAGLTAAGYGLDKVTEPVREAVQEKIESKIGPWDRLGAGANLGGLAGAVPGMALMSKSPEAGLAAAVGGGLLGGIGGQYLENKLRGRTPEEQVVSKLASILASYKTAGSEGALGDGSAVAPGGMDVGQAVPQEAGAPTAGTPEQIEKLKKILLMMQLKKQQEEAAMAQAQQGNMQVPPEMTAQTSPGAVQGI
ncbi:hypothetical protein E6Q11_02835 [Candidatus Dojkabacteria bacterium]|uniref:Uncharacterized protein n=1 Tax=Candidatus Dojkabacteria bacterium TaxID=2099670 RepID=A0A5C7J7J3_9BACT|nr:MAG: hypothetical protein E6Q11_02835 [Candidatus Dojkabacteria bacterium]